MGMPGVAEASLLSVSRNQSRHFYRPEIDGLRAFAVCAVIINHFNRSLLPSGYLGVDIFFVISGYVITSSLASREYINFGDFLGGFYERRIKRLVPALLVFVLVASVFTCLLNPQPQLALGTGLASLFGVSNLYLLKQSTDYFAQSTELNPFIHTWSLGVEEQFYLLFPFLIWFSGFSRQAPNGARNLLLWILALTGASVAYFVFLSHSNPPAAYFLMPSRFWEMAVGCLVCVGVQKRVKFERALEQIPPSSVVGIMVAVMLLPKDTAMLAKIAIVVLAAILLACLKGGTAIYALFTNKKLVYIGLISYSLYLWHWGILAISRWSIGIHWWTLPVQILLMFLCASVSYEYIESQVKKWDVSRSKAIGVGIITLLGAGGILRGMERSMVGAYSINEDQGMIPGTQINRQNCHLKPLLFTPQDMATCSLRVPGNKRTLFIIGDSHASALVPIYMNSDLKSRLNLVISTRPGGQFISVGAGPPPESGLARLNYDRMKYLIPAVKKGDLVLLVHHFMADLDPLHPRPDVDVIDVTERRGALERVSQSLADLGLLLRQKGTTLIVFSPLPNFHHDLTGFNLENCRNARFLQGLHACQESRVNREEMIGRLSDVRSALRRLEQRGNLLVFDGFNVICSPQFADCSTHFPGERRGPKAMFRDMDHLSRVGAEYLSPTFVMFLRQKGLLVDH